MSSAFKRITKLQRQVLKTIRADVRKTLGPQTRDIRRYYDAYKREFRGSARHSSKEELLKECVKSDLILLGDYHTFAQSQKTALKLLRELFDWDSPVVLGLEMVPSLHQEVLNNYLAGNITDAELLEDMEYESNWGFPWEQFKPLLTFAKEHHLEVLALNFDCERLMLRDVHAANLLAAYSAARPKKKILVLYGDLHLARGHIPRFLKAALKKRGAKRRILTVFQNSESLYWKLAEQHMAHAVDVLALGRKRYCIMNAAPWVKLQSYLEWAEASQLFEAEDGAGANLHEIAHERLRILAEALDLKLPANLDFTIQTLSDLSFLNKSSNALSALTRDQQKAVKYHVLGNRSILIPGLNLIYLASTSVNALSESVSLLAHASLSQTRTIFTDSREHFFSAVLSSMIGYFGSKVLNHKRKCDLEDDFRLQLERPMGRGALPQERLQRRAAKLVLKHCQAQREYHRTKRYRAPLSQRGPGRMPVFLETARKLGAILGEKLYASYVENRYPAVKIERLFRTKLEDFRQTRALYLEVVQDLEEAPLGHTSKLDLF